MTFSDQQREQLWAPLDPSLVKVKPTPGSPRYIPGYAVMEAANRIFGQEHWGYTIDNLSHIDAAGGVLYTAQVTVTVTGCHPKQDIGCEIASATRDGKPPSAQAHETAIKGSITDGIKRALRTYGDQMGLSLYDKDANINAEYAQWLREEAGEIESPPTKPRSALAVVPAPVDVEALRTAVLQRLEADPDAASKLPKPAAEMTEAELVKTTSWLSRRARASS